MMAMRRTVAVLGLLGVGMGLAAAPVPPATTQGRGGRGGGRGGGGAPMIPMTEPADVPMVRVDQNWSGRHTALVARAKQGDVDLYMMGDSITDNWAGGTYRASWDKYFTGWKAANFAIGGDRVEHILWRAKNGELDGVKPKVIVLLAGTNNLPKTQYNYAADTPEETAAGIKAILAVIKEKQPQAKVLLVSVFPRDYAGDAGFGMAEKIKALNGLIAKMADGKDVKYLDIHDKFLGADGKVDPALMQPDKLHPIAAGYDVWGTAMTPILTEWLGAPAK